MMAADVTSENMFPARQMSLAAFNTILWRRRKNLETFQFQIFGNFCRLFRTESGSFS